MPLGTEVGLGLRDIVLHGDPAPPSLKGTTPNFRPMSVVDGLIKIPLGMKVGLSPGISVFDGDPATPRKKAHSPPPNFWPMSIVAKGLDRSTCHLVRR